MPKRPTVSFDLNVKEGHEGYHTIAKCPPPPGWKEVQQQRSQTSGNHAPTLTVAQQKALATRRQNMAYSIATKPGQQLMMQAFMLWMSGSQLNMFSISVTTMAIVAPLSAVCSVDRTFAHLKEVDLLLPKLLFLGLNLVFLGVGLYKMSSMRLLPTTSADWTSKIVWKDMYEASSVPPQDSTTLLS